MLHMTKLCVGISDIAQLRRLQAERLAAGGTLRHRTRNFPRRAHEVTDGGSLYWVIAGATVVRQRVLDIVEDHWDDGARCAALLFDAELVPLAGRLTRAFQGWRYLDPAAAPVDLASAAQDADATALPPALRRELVALGLL